MDLCLAADWGMWDMALCAAESARVRRSMAGAEEEGTGEVQDGCLLC